MGYAPSNDSLRLLLDINSKNNVEKCTSISIPHIPLPKNILNIVRCLIIKKIIQAYNSLYQLC